MENSIKDLPIVEDVKSPQNRTELKVVEVELRTYKRRWAVLVVITFCLVAVGYNRACFGVVSNIYSLYFKVDVAAVDWLTLSMSAVSLIIGLSLLLILPFWDLKFRTFCIVTSTSVAITYSCLLASALKRSFFFFSVVGQVVMGVANTTALAMIPVVAALWFPKEEIATAVGICLGGIAVGNILGFNIPPHLLDSEPGDSLWIADIRYRMTMIFLVLLLMSLIVVLITIAVVEDQPQKPPTLSEAKKRSELTDQAVDIQHTWQGTLHYLKMVCYDRTFLALVICFGIVETCYMLEVLMMADILRYANSDLSSPTDSNILAGYFLSLYAAGALGGGVTGGIVLDKTKRFKEVSIVTAIFMSLFSVGFFVAVVFESVASSALTNFFYGFFNAACYTCLYEVIVQHMYPCSEMALGCWIALFINVSSLVVPLLGRLIYSLISKFGVLLFQTLVLLVATVTIACLQPRYERYSVNKNENNIQTDTTPLVTNSK